MPHRPATFTESNIWVHLPSEWFTHHFPSIHSVWPAARSQAATVALAANCRRGLEPVKQTPGNPRELPEPLQVCMTQAWHRPISFLRVLA